jgi:hypothetical protein
MIEAAVSMHTLADVRLVDLPNHSRHDGEVIVAEAASGLPFAAARMFTVKAPNGAERGKHAHLRCSQFMICVSGVVDIVCDDGENRKIFSLNRSDLALHVPSTIWNTVVFQQSGSILAVLCDRPYEEDDYIREYSQFIAMRKAARS